VRRGGQLVNTVTQPGALIGEISVLLDTTYSATVEATERSTLRRASDAQAFLASDPAIATFVAVGLAQRLNFVTTYLADLKHQYGDAPGLAMVPDVLSRLAQQQTVVARSGSVRDPDPDY
jgi:CRP-like cAMP-binding protein